MKRRLLLRHRDGFPEPQFRAFVAQCEIWRATIEATVAHWDDLSMGRLGIPRPIYHFGEPELSADRTLASLPLDGELGAAALKVLEPDVPEALFADFPIWFRLDLELARAENGAEPHFAPAIDPVRASAIKESPLFKKS